MGQTRLMSRSYGTSKAGHNDDFRVITLRRDGKQLVIYEADDGALDWDDNCLGRGRARRAALNEMWDYYADDCDGNGEAHYGEYDGVTLLRAKLTTM